jgi:hypothetical protein
MPDRTSPNPRRRFIKLAVTGLAATPFAGALTIRTAHAAPVAVKEADPLAAAVGYKADATKAPARKDAAALCGNCNSYSGAAGAADGPCVIFQGNLVSAKGWCTAWTKKA